MSKPYIINDANGNPINAKYPPNREKYGDLYEGYKTWAEEVLFHRFGVLCYDVCFTYKNKEYFLLKEQNYAAVCDEHFTEEYEVYANEMELLENFKITDENCICVFMSVSWMSSQRRHSWTQVGLTFMH